MWQFQTLGEVLDPSFKSGVFSLFQGGITHITLQFMYDGENENDSKRFNISWDPATNDIHFDLKWAHLLGDALCLCRYKYPPTYGDIFAKTLTVIVAEKY